mgnify:CR=1 FL=1
MCTTRPQVGLTPSPLRSVPRRPRLLPGPSTGDDRTPGGPGTPTARGISSLLLRRGPRAAGPTPVHRRTSSLRWARSSGQPRLSPLLSSWRTSQPLSSLHSHRHREIASPPASALPGARSSQFREPYGAQASSQAHRCSSRCGRHAAGHPAGSATARAASPGSSLFQPGRSSRQAPLPATYTARIC